MLKIDRRVCICSRVFLLYPLQETALKLLQKKFLEFPERPDFYYTFYMKIYFFTVSYKDSVFREFQRCNKIVRETNIKDALNKLKKDLFPDTEKLIVENVYSEEE